MGDVADLPLQYYLAQRAKTVRDREKDRYLDWHSDRQK